MLIQFIQEFTKDTGRIKKVGETMECLRSYASDLISQGIAVEVGAQVPTEETQEEKPKVVNKSNQNKKGKK